MNVWIVLIIAVVMVEGIFILKWKVATAALIYYMEIKKYTHPNSEEMEVCTKYVVEKMVRDLFSAK